MAEATAPADVTKELEIAKKYLTAKNYAKAKVILEDLDHPTAKRWLQKIEEMELFNDAPFATSSQNNRKSQSQSNLLLDVTSIFLTNDWKVTTQLGNTVILEKRNAPSSFTSAFLLAIFGLIGMFIVLIGIANGKVERVTLNEMDDGTVRLTAANQALPIRRPEDVVSIAQSIKKGATYPATLAIGIGATIIWMFILRL